jgi:uncharacterized protein DUF4185
MQLADAGAIVYEAQPQLEAGGPTTIAADNGMPANPWTSMFDRTSGWTGADGVYSIPLVENDRLASATTASKTFWTFSDTFIGSVDANDHRSSGSYLIHNSTALLTGNSPGPSNIVFNTRTAIGGAAAPMFSDNLNGSWFWPVDGVVVGSSIYLFSLRMKQVVGGFGFDYEGITLFSTPISQGNLINSPPLFTSYSQIDNTGLYVAASGNIGAKIFGQAVMNNSAEAGAYKPDGFVYVYGVRNDSFNKKLIVARVARAQVGNLSQYRFYNGSAWVAGAANAAPLSGADHLASEFSVTPLPDGRYVLVFNYDDILDNEIDVRYSNSAVGPWSAPTRIYTCPEAHLTANTYVYGAKAHPALSRRGELLISYHVNTFDFNEDFTNADIYHPRFITVKLNQPAGPVALDLPVAQSASEDTAGDFKLVDLLDQPTTEIP